MHLVRNSHRFSASISAVATITLGLYFKHNWIWSSISENCDVWKLLLGHLVLLLGILKSWRLLGNMKIIGKKSPFSGQGYRPSTASLNNIPFHYMFIYNRVSLIKAFKTFKSWQCKVLCVQCPHNFKFSERSQLAHSFFVLSTNVISLLWFLLGLFRINHSSWHPLLEAMGYCGDQFLPSAHTTTTKLCVTRTWVYFMLTQLKSDCYSFWIKCVFNCDQVSF